MNKMDILKWDNFVLYCFDDDRRLVDMYLDIIQSRYTSILYKDNNYNITSIEYNRIFGIVFNVIGYYNRIAHTAITDIYE